MTTTVIDKNLVSIPDKLAHDLGITPGTQLDWQPTEYSDTLLVKVLPDRAALAASLQGAGRKHLKAGEDPIERLIAERVREDAEREAAL